MAGAPLELCQNRFDYAETACPLNRCPQPWPPGCGQEQDVDCDEVLDFGIPNYDNCTYMCNPGQENSDGDFMGDACDPCPSDMANDLDNDGICGDVDNCPAYPNAGQANADSDAFGDACDQMPNTPNPESTIAGLDTRIDALETMAAASVPAAYPDVNCNGIAGPDEGACQGMVLNALGLAVCSALVPGVPCDHFEDLTAGANTAATCNDGAATLLDLDGDGLGNACDNCDADYNPTQADGDLDGIGDACE
jgi:hypothetical protein